MPLMLFSTIISCESQSNVAPEKTTTLLQSNEFTFMAKHANPSGYEVLNVLNSLPNLNANTILNLDQGYVIEIKKDEIRVDLPYFGRMYTPNFDRDKDSFRFTSKNFTINQTSGRKGSFIYTILPKDQPNITRLILEVFKNGKSYLSISANDRQSISYDGYLTENKLEKK